MVLPSSGQLAFSQINTELGRSAGSLITINSASNGLYATINPYSPSKPNSADPESVSEWYSYNHSATTTTTVACYSYAVTDVTFTSPSGLAACVQGSYPLTKYSTCNGIATNCTMYTNSTCTNIDYQPATYTFQTNQPLNFEINFLGVVANTASPPC